MGLAHTSFRLGLGALFAGHGLQKLGQLGGPGLDATAEGFAHMGFDPPKPYAAAAAVTEVVGGGLLALGYHTPLAASMVTGAMTVAIAKVHSKNGLWITKGGMEYNLALIGAAFAIAETGPGLLSVDGILGKRRRGPGWAVAELAVGVAAGLGVAALAGRGAAPAPAPVDAAAGTPTPTAGTVAEGVGSAVDPAPPLGSSATAGTGTADHVADRAGDAADKVGDAAGKAADTTKQVAAKVADKVGQVSDTVSDAADKAADKTGEAADKAADKTGDAAGKAADKAGDAARGASR